MTALFPFVQLEFTHSVGPPEGRYVVHPEAEDDEPELEDAEAGAELLEADDPLPLGSADVLVVKIIGAPAPKPKWFRRGMPPQVDAEGPRELSVTLVTVIFATNGFAEGRGAEDWLTGLRSDGEGLEAWVADALTMVNRAVGAYRACAADPYVVELTRADPRAVRVGYGDATQVVMGDWTRAVGVAPPPPPRVTRTVQLMPTQGMAAVLAGQATVLESEDLVLRALLDLQHDRLRGAAVGLQAGIELLLGEITGEVLAGVVQQRVDALLALRERADALAAAARRGTLAQADVDDLREIAEAAGALIDQRRYAPMGF